MGIEEITVTLVASLLSGSMGVWISTYYYRRYEYRKTKMDTFKRFFSNRFDIKGDAFLQALNEILIVFRDSKPVMEALAQHHKAVTSGLLSEDELVKLFKAMCKDLDFDLSNFNDSFFLMPYNSRPTSAMTNQKCLERK